MLLVYGHLPGQVTETGSDAICPDNACRIRNGWQTPRSDSGDGTTRTGRTGGTGRTRSLYIIYILYAVEHDRFPRGKSWGQGVSAAFCRPSEFTPSERRSRRSGATASPFRRNGITVPAQRHRRFKASEHPFRAFPAGEKGAVARGTPGF